MGHSPTDNHFKINFLSEGSTMQQFSPRCIIALMVLLMGLIILHSPVYGYWSDNTTVVSSNKVVLQGGVAQQHIIKTAPPMVMLQHVKRSGNGFLGLELAIRPKHNPRVLSVFSGSPAEQMGIVPGDELLSAEGYDLFDRSPHEVDWALPNVVGQPVNVKIRRGLTVKLVYLWVAPLRRAG
jgi:hypothetical protein